METFGQRLVRIFTFYMRWCVIPWAIAVVILLLADAVWRML